MSLHLRGRPLRLLPQALAGLAAGRAGLGLVVLVRPAWLPGGLGAPPAAHVGTGWVVQMLGAREVGLGLGALAAARRGDHRAERAWLAAGLLSDAVDAAALGRAAGAGSVGRVPGLAVAGVAALASAVQAAGLVARR